MSASFDVIIIGVGSMGSAACYFVAKEGVTVLGIDQFDAPHEYGSHTGQSRIIRKAYFEDPGYVPLLNTAFDNWKKLEEETNSQLYYRTGLVYFGAPDNKMMKGIKRSAQLYNVKVEQIDRKAVGQRFPQFTTPPHFECLFEPDAGFITPEKAISLYKQQALKNGAELRANEKVLTWQKRGRKIFVTTSSQDYECDKLIITTGAWAGKMTPGLADIIKVTRQVVFWVQPETPERFMLPNFPCWMIADDQRPGAYYGFPMLAPQQFGGPAGLKLAHHYPGNVTDPDGVNPEVPDEDRKNLLYAIDKYLPEAGNRVNAVKTCLYANTNDENFIIDKLADHGNQVVIACGFSGHGFKFVSVVGEILAELAVKGKTTQPIEFLSASRFVPKL